jgi:hypothetical protein
MLSFASDKTSSLDTPVPILEGHPGSTGILFSIGK